MVIIGFRVGIGVHVWAGAFRCGPSSSGRVDVVRVEEVGVEIQTVPQAQIPHDGPVPLAEMPGLALVAATDQPVRFQP